MTPLSGNCVESPADAVLVYGHDGKGPAGETVITNNQLRAAGLAVKVPGLGGGLTVKGNVVDGALDPKLKSGGTTVVANNKPAAVKCAPCWPTPKSMRWLPVGAPAVFADAKKP